MSDEDTKEVKRDKDTRTTGKLTMANIPDWMKIVVLLAGCFASAGGGTQVLGKNYDPQFAELKTDLKTIKDSATADHDKLIRLETELDQLKRQSGK